MVFYAAETVIAKKELECYECGKIINVGEECYRKEENEELEELMEMCLECREKYEKIKAVAQMRTNAQVRINSALLL